MKNKFYFLVILFVSLFFKSFSQGYEIGERIGSKETTQIIMIGSDEENFYTIKLEQESKKQKSGSLEAYSLDDMKKVYSIGFGSDQLDENLESIVGFYISKVGIVCAYTRITKSPKSFSLMFGVMSFDGKSGWESKPVIEIMNEGSSDNYYFVIKQRDDLSFICYSRKQMSQTNYYFNLVPVAYLNPQLEEKFNKVCTLECTRAVVNDIYLSKSNMIYLFYSEHLMKSPTFIPKVLTINSSTGEIRNKEIWDYDKALRTKNYTLLYKDKVAFADEENGNVIACIPFYWNKVKDENKEGFALIKFDSNGFLIEKKSITWDEKILSKDAYGKLFDIKSIVPLGENKYSINMCSVYTYSNGYTSSTINYNFVNSVIENEKFLSTNHISRYVETGDNAKDYNFQFMYQKRERTFYLYNQMVKYLKNDESTRTSDFWTEVRAAGCLFDGNGYQTQKDLNIVIDNHKDCQIQPTQSVMEGKSKVITVARAGDFLYFVKINLDVI